MTELVHELALAAQGRPHARPTSPPPSTPTRRSPRRIGEAANLLGRACTACERMAEIAGHAHAEAVGRTDGSGTRASLPGSRSRRRRRAPSARPAPCSTTSSCTPSATEARCPNKGECFAAGTATFLILGDRCTRACGFCAVEHAGAGRGRADRPATSRRASRDGALAEAARLGLSHVVVTSVTRDDLPTAAPRSSPRRSPRCAGRCRPRPSRSSCPTSAATSAALAAVLAARPDVLSHNLETVPRLYPGACGRRRLRALAGAAASASGADAARAQRPASRQDRPHGRPRRDGRRGRRRPRRLRRRRRGRRHHRPVPAAATRSCLPVARYVPPARVRRRSSGPARSSGCASSPAPSCARPTAPARSSRHCGGSRGGADRDASAVAAPCPRDRQARPLRRRLHRCSSRATCSRPPGTGAIGERFGLDLDTSRWHEAERAAYRAVKQRRRGARRRRTTSGALPRHRRRRDRALWAVATRTAVRRAPTPSSPSGCDVENFALYDDVAAVSRAARAAPGVRMGLVSNTSRDLDEFVAALRAGRVRRGRRGERRDRPGQAVAGDLRRGARARRRRSRRRRHGRRQRRGRREGRPRLRHGRRPARPRRPSRPAAADDPHARRAAGAAAV